ncbi:helix-turn-helix domain-containing protein [Sphingobacterium sp. SGL-16]|uniref:helix-turn-helix domain-containing protein n=1 Tax=Sphingobacterium sp. SGL-16 TaxID=2710883 RepID=UPI0013ED9C04|nr:helix-turn-helix domain-containing protein [Sphingobacterium sp. SGL-16]NGM71677.1 helix-turn-helix domain-containing protein [Sphingobacterium sp. SGL-16]
MMITNLTFDQLPSEVARQGAILEQIQYLLRELLGKPEEKKEAFLNIDEASEFLGLTKATLYVKVSRREVPSIRRGKKLYFSTLDLINYLKGGKRKTNKEIKEDDQSYLKKKGVSNG